MSEVVIVGGGVAGLAAARRLHERGVETVVLDKGRALGGRMATRRIGDARFDHGAQHFSARSPDFRDQVDAWTRRAVVRPWYRSASTTHPERGIEPRYVGTDGMRRIAETIGRGLDVRTSVTVDRLETRDGGVAAIANGAVVAVGAVVILTPPVPQTVQLLEASTITVPADVVAMLDSIGYDACLAVMARLGQTSGLSDGHLSLATGPVAWIGDNHHKGISAEPAVTIHSTPEFAAAHLEADPGRWSPMLCEAARPHLGGDIIEATPHRWRWARPQTTLGVGAVSFDAGFPVVLAGEAFAGALVEGAYTSGVAAADVVLGLP